MFVKVKIEEWELFPGDRGPLPDRLPSSLRSVEVFSREDSRIEKELKEKLYLQYGAVPKKMKFEKKGE